MAYLIQQTEGFVKWRKGLCDLKAKAAILRRMDRISAGLIGDAKSVGDGVSELRVNVGPGYRMYFYGSGAGRDYPSGRRRQEHASCRHQAGEKACD